MFIAFLCLGGAEGSFTFKILFSPSHPFGGEIVILRAFMMHNKDMVWANNGIHYLAILADPAHSSSKFGNDCLGDLAYTENQEPRTIAALLLSP